MATDIFPWRAMGSRETSSWETRRSCHSSPPFSFSLFLCLSRLCFFLRDILALFLFSFFFFFFGFPSCARLPDSRRLGARHVLYVLEKLEDFRNSWTFHLSLWSARKKKMDDRSFACYNVIISPEGHENERHKFFDRFIRTISQDVKIWIIWIDRMATGTRANSLFEAIYSNGVRFITFSKKRIIF